MDVHGAGRSLDGYVCADRWDWRVFCVAQNRSLADRLTHRVIGGQTRRSDSGSLLRSRSREQYRRGEPGHSNNLAAIEFHIPSPVRDTSPSLTGLFSPQPPQTRKHVCWNKVSALMSGQAVRLRPDLSPSIQLNLRSVSGTYC